MYIYEYSFSETTVIHIQFFTIAVSSKVNGVIISPLKEDSLPRMQNGNELD